MSTDDELRPRLAELVRFADVSTLSAPSSPLVVGDVAYVFAFGAWRRGLVTSISTRGVHEIAYLLYAGSLLVERKKTKTPLI